MDDEQYAFFRKVVNGRRTHHLYVLTQDSPRPQEYLLLRDYVRADAPVAEKSDYVTALLSKARHWRTHIDDLPT